MPTSRSRCFQFRRTLFLLLGMLIRRNQLISTPHDYFPGREWVNGSAVHLFASSFPPPPAASLPFDTRVQLRLVPLSRFSLVENSLLDPSSPRITSPFMISISRQSSTRFIVPFPRPIDAAAAAAAAAMLVFDSRIIYNRGGHATARLRANTRNTAYTYRTNESFIIGRALKKIPTRRLGRKKRLT